MINSNYNSYDDYVTDAWITYIISKLPNLDNTKYNVKLSVEWNNIKQEYDIKCDCDIIKSISTNIKMPANVFYTNDLTNFDNYMNLIISNLTNQINNEEPSQNYIEINGVKYYPKEE